MSMNHPSWGDDERTARICPKTGPRVGSGRARRWASWALPFIGLVYVLSDSYVLK